MAVAVGIRQWRSWQSGIHEVDIARWGLGVKYPTKISAIGGHFMFDDDQETPNSLTCAFEFVEPGKPKKMMTFEVRHWMTHHEADIKDFDTSVKSNTVGNIFYGSNGYLAIDGYKKYYSVIGKDQTPGPAREDGGDHFANFITGVRSRNRGELTAEIEEGAISPPRLCILRRFPTGSAAPWISTPPVTR